MKHVRELIRREKDRARLRSLLLEGAGSPPEVTADAEYFARLREKLPRPGAR